MLDESEFLSPFGVRSLSKVHGAHPYIFKVDGHEFCVEYKPGESDATLFGGNSNWRGPVWFPVNHLITESLAQYHRYYGETFKVECPTGSGRQCTLQEVAHEVRRRQASLFLSDRNRQRPCHGSCPPDRSDPEGRDLVLFHEYFDADTGRGLGASHQTGWTALVIHCLESLMAQKTEGR
jgi:hypothetical protein